jgi:hypothetical protein
MPPTSGIGVKCLPVSARYYCCPSSTAVAPRGPSDHHATNFGFFDRPFAATATAKRTFPSIAARCRKFGSFQMSLAPRLFRSLRGPSLVQEMQKRGASTCPQAFNATSHYSTAACTVVLVLFLVYSCFGQSSPRHPGGLSTILDASVGRALVARNQHLSSPASIDYRRDNKPTRAASSNPGPFELGSSRRLCNAAIRRRGLCMLTR